MIHFKATALVLAMSSGGIACAATPTAWHVGTGAKAPFANPSGLAVLYDQSANDSGTGIISQNFESSFDIYDNQAADDFTVPKGKTWTIQEVDAIGFYVEGPGPAMSQHVTFYSDKKGKPGAVVADYPGLTGTDNSGHFAITLPKKGLKLKAGKYWLSVQADLNYFPGGEWIWASQTTVEGTATVWQNPGDAFGTGCTTYTTESTCLPYGLGDHMFILTGNAK